MEDFFTSSASAAQLVGQHSDSLCCKLGCAALQDSWAGADPGTPALE